MINETFGQWLRRTREGEGITLRKFAEMVERTPTYISKIERGELDPPAEEVLRDVARILKQDVDDVISRAGRVPSDLPEIIKRQPHEMALMLRTAKRMSPEQLTKLLESMQAMTAKTGGKKKDG